MEPTATRPRTLAPGVAFVLVGVVLGAVLFAASAPSPLYPVYAQRFDFSPTTLTAIFAVYAFALIVTLLLTGSLSDRVGRRPVLLVSLLVLAAAMAVFVVADGVGWLFVARILQGLGTGVATGTLSAVLLDLQPRPGTGSTVSAVGPSFGLAVGALATGALVQYGPAPRQLVFWLLLAVFLLSAAALAVVPETVAPRPGWRQDLRPRVGVPAAARATFVAVAPMVVAGWAFTGFYLSLGSSLTADLTGDSDRLVAALPLAALFGAAGIASLLTPRWTAERAVLIGAPLFVVGVGLTIAGIAADSFWLYLVGSVVGGLGFGPSFAGSLRALAPLVEPAERGRLLTAVYVTAYLGFSAPALVAGLLTTHLGLRPTADAYAAVVIVLALGATAAYAVTRRRAE
ncbi:MAG TPA: MFS transporter [Mycobacteriales bacterium]|jgi:MFS family permease|nr:MFS transporter [Mycobacteriales bacterium]